MVRVRYPICKENRGFTLCKPKGDGRPNVDNDGVPLDPKSKNLDGTKLYRSLKVKGWGRENRLPADTCRRAKLSNCRLRAWQKDNKGPDVYYFIEGDRSSPLPSIPAAPSAPADAQGQGKAGPNHLTEVQIKARVNEISELVERADLKLLHMLKVESQADFPTFELDLKSVSTIMDRTKELLSSDARRIGSALSTMTMTKYQSILKNYKVAVEMWNKMRTSESISNPAEARSLLALKPKAALQKFAALSQELSRIMAGIVKQVSDNSTAFTPDIIKTMDAAIEKSRVIIEQLKLLSFRVPRGNRDDSTTSLQGLIGQRRKLLNIIQARKMIPPSSQPARGLPVQRQSAMGMRPLDAKKLADIKGRVDTFLQKYHELFMMGKAKRVAVNRQEEFYEMAQGFRMLTAEILPSSKTKEMNNLLRLKGASLLKELKGELEAYEGGRVLKVLSAAFRLRMVEVWTGSRSMSDERIAACTAWRRREEANKNSKIKRDDKLWKLWSFIATDQSVFLVVSGQIIKNDAFEEISALKSFSELVEDLDKAYALLKGTGITDPNRKRYQQDFIVKLTLLNGREDATASEASKITEKYFNMLRKALFVPKKQKTKDVKSEIGIASALIREIPKTVANGERAGYETYLKTKIAGLIDEIRVELGKVSYKANGGREEPILTEEQYDRIQALFTLCEMLFLGIRDKKLVQELRSKFSEVLGVNGSNKNQKYVCGKPVHPFGESCSSTSEIKEKLDLKKYHYVELRELYIRPEFKTLGMQGGTKGSEYLVGYRVFPSAIDIGEDELQKGGEKKRARRAAQAVALEQYSNAAHFLNAYLRSTMVDKEVKLSNGSITRFASQFEKDGFKGVARSEQEFGITGTYKIYVYKDRIDKNLAIATLNTLSGKGRNHETFGSNPFAMVPKHYEPTRHVVSAESVKIPFRVALEIVKHRKQLDISEETFCVARGSEDDAKKALELYRSGDSKKMAEAGKIEIGYYFGHRGALEFIIKKIGETKEISGKETKGRVLTGVTRQDEDLFVARLSQRTDVTEVNKARKKDDDHKQWQKDHSQTTFEWQKWFSYLNLGIGLGTSTLLFGGSIVISTWLGRRQLKLIGRSLELQEQMMGGDRDTYLRKQPAEWLKLNTTDMMEKAAKGEYNHYSLLEPLPVIRRMLPSLKLVEGKGANITNLIADPGQGKTATLRCMALFLHQWENSLLPLEVIEKMSTLEFPEKFPVNLKKIKLYWLDLGHVQAGSQLLGSAEQKLLYPLWAIEALNREYLKAIRSGKTPEKGVSVVVMDQFGTVNRLAVTQGNSGASEYIKGPLGDGWIPALTAMTQEEQNVGRQSGETGAMEDRTVDIVLPKIDHQKLVKMNVEAARKIAADQKVTFEIDLNGYVERIIKISAYSKGSVREINVIIATLISDASFKNGGDGGRVDSGLFERVMTDIFGQAYAEYKLFEPTRSVVESELIKNNQEVSLSETVKMARSLHWKWTQQGEKGVPSQEFISNRIRESLAPSAPNGSTENGTVSANDENRRKVSALLDEAGRVIAEKNVRFSGEPNLLIKAIYGYLDEANFPSHEIHAKAREIMFWLINEAESSGKEVLDLVKVHYDEIAPRYERLVQLSGRGGKSEVVQRTNIAKSEGTTTGLGRMNLRISPTGVAEAMSPFGSSDWGNLEPLGRAIDRFVGGVNRVFDGAQRVANNVINGAMRVVTGVQHAAQRVVVKGAARGASAVVTYSSSRVLRLSKGAAIQKPNQWIASPPKADRNDVIKQPTLKAGVGVDLLKQGKPSHITPPSPEGRAPIVVNKVASGVALGGMGLIAAYLPAAALSNPNFHPAVQMMAHPAGLAGGHFFFASTMGGFSAGAEFARLRSRRTRTGRRINNFGRSAVGSLDAFTGNTANNLMNLKMLGHGLALSKGFSWLGEKAAKGLGAGHKWQMIAGMSSTVLGPVALSLAPEAAMFAAKKCLSGPVLAKVMTSLGKAVVATGAAPSIIGVGISVAGWGLFFNDLRLAVNHRKAVLDAYEEFMQKKLSVRQKELRQEAIRRLPFNGTALSTLSFDEYEFQIFKSMAMVHFEWKKRDADNAKKKLGEMINRFVELRGMNFINNQKLWEEIKMRSTNEDPNLAGLSGLAKDILAQMRRWAGLEIDTPDETMLLGWLRNEMDRHLGELDGFYKRFTFAPQQPNFLVQ